MQNSTQTQTQERKEVVLFTDWQGWDAVKKAKKYGAWFDWDTKAWSLHLDYLGRFSPRKIESFLTDWGDCLDRKEKAFVKGIIKAKQKEENIARRKKARRAEETRKENERKWQALLVTLPPEYARRIEKSAAAKKVFSEKGLLSPETLISWLGEAANPNNLQLVVRAFWKNYKEKGIAYKYFKDENCDLQIGEVLEKVMNAYARHHLTPYDFASGVAKGEMTELGRNTLGF